MNIDIHILILNTNVLVDVGEHLCSPKTKQKFTISEGVFFQSPKHVTSWCGLKQKGSETDKMVYTQQQQQQQLLYCEVGGGTSGTVWTNRSPIDELIRSLVIRRLGLPCDSTTSIRKWISDRVKIKKNDDDYLFYSFCSPSPLLSPPPKRKTTVQRAN